MKTITLPLKHSMHRVPCRLALLIPLAFTCFALSPQARAVCQEGCDLTNGNTFLGDDALVNNTDGFSNTAIGAQALFSNTHGFQNTATGGAALQNNTTGSDNTATGFFALQNNTTGIINTATGALALQNNTTGTANTATGWQALVSNTTGNGNTATGEAALNLNTTGDYNTANGYFALEFNTGEFNTATGALALEHNTTGNSNTASGYQALEKNRTGNNNIALGYQAGENLTGSDNIDIANAGAANESGKIRIGTNGIHTNTFIAGISGVTVANGVGVIIDARGHLGTAVSSERFKEGIKPMDKTSQAILALKPVTFRYKHELDPAGIPQFGLVAEDVEKVNPDLVARDEQGRPYTVRYEAVNAMLLNEFLKEHKAFVAEQRKVQDQGATIARLEQQIETLAAGLQKVTAQLELSKSAPRMILNGAR
jgi:hypothetical protein